LARLAVEHMGESLLREPLREPTPTAWSARVSCD